MAKYKVTIEWDDTPDKLDTAWYVFEVLSVSPFKFEESKGWELVLKPESQPKMRIKDWLTVQVSDKAQAWRLGKLKKFLESVGLTKEPRNITHRDLLGLRVRGFVKKGPHKVRGEERIQSRVSRYEAVTEVQQEQQGNELDEII